MSPVQAYQHIYSNVEQAQSPTGRGGFQTLFYTRSGLTEAEVSEMEGRLLYFSSKVEPVKRLFFTLSGGKGVIAQITALTEPDQFGRKGRYLAHSLVFEPEDLARFQADPFRVFRSFSFVSTVAEALAQGNFKSGDISPVALTLSEKLAGDVRAAESWPPAALKKLALLALRVEQQARERDAIIFAGNEAQIEQSLEAAFLALPLALRPRCSFDTYFYRCNLVATYFWAVGLPEPPARIKFALVNGATREVQGEIPAQLKTAYEHWALTAIEAKRLTYIARQRDLAFALAEWLDGRPYNQSHLQAASSELITDLLAVNPQAVRAMLRRKMADLLPPLLIDRAVDVIFTNANTLVDKPSRKLDLKPESLHSWSDSASEQLPGRSANTLALYRRLQQGFTAPQLAKAVYQSYAAQSFVRPPKKELKALEAFLKRQDCQALRVLWAYWDNPRKQLPKALAQADETTYRQFVEAALRLKLVEPLDLLAPGKGDAFLDLYLKTTVDDWAELVEALLDIEEPACLSRLTQDARQFSGQDLRRVERLLAREDNVPALFQQAVEEAAAAAPKDGKFKGLLRGLWRR